MTRYLNVLTVAWIPTLKRVLLWFSLVGCIFSLVLSSLLAAVGIFAPVPQIPAGDDVAAGQALSLDDDLGPVLQILIMVMGCMALTFLGPPRRQMGLALPKAPVLGMVAAFCMTLAGDMFVIYLQLLLPASAGDPGGTVATAWQTQSTKGLFIRSLSAGVVEEYLLLAVPVGAAVLVCTGINKFLRSAQVAPLLIHHLQVFGYALAAGLLFIVPRSEIHAYQGRNSVISAAVWTSLHLAVYLIYKSVWPLILAHASFNFVVASGSLGDAFSPWYITCEIVLLAVGVIAVLAANRPRDARQAAAGVDTGWWEGR